MKKTDDSPPVPEQIEKIKNIVSDSTKNILRDYLLFSLLLISAGALIYLLFPNLIPNPDWSWGVEAPGLEPSAKTRFRPGDIFLYNTTDGKTNHNYEIISYTDPKCPGIKLADEKSAISFYGTLENADKNEPGVYDLCIDEDGWQIDADSNKLGSLISFENTSWPFFSPWMLVLEEEQEFEVNRTLSINDAQTSKIVFSFKVLNSTTYRGRDAFVVHIKNKEDSAIGPARTGLDMLSDSAVMMFVDKEYRILLYSESEDITIDLVSAPFELEDPILYSTH